MVPISVWVEAARRTGGIREAEPIPYAAARASGRASDAPLHRYLVMSPKEERQRAANYHTRVNISAPFNLLGFPFLST
ncbi:hypothetical protein BCCGELA001_30230 [Bradyrhizobium sp. CCGE-LA001]|nr:hypothetical protein BCCGELA001_30230 [Bradyrhizobium sp. CCGE-LA001]